jgi:hypothetical protein
MAPIRIVLTDGNARPFALQRVNTKKWGGAENNPAATLVED